MNAMLLAVPLLALSASGGFAFGSSMDTSFDITGGRGVTERLQLSTGEATDNAAQNAADGLN